MATFRHIVMLRWNETVADAFLAEVVAGLTACATALPGTLGYTCGPDVQAGAGAPRYDFALVGDFADEEAWKAYDLDAEHNRLRAELIGPKTAERAVLQYWVS